MVQSTVVRHWVKGFLYSTSPKLCCCYSGTQLCLTFVALWTVACQVPQSMGFFRQDYWSELPFPPPGHLPNLETEPESPVSPALQVDSLQLNHRERPHLSSCVCKAPQVSYSSHFSPESPKDDPQSSRLI